MKPTILFVTGQLAEPSLHRILEEMKERDFDYQIQNLGIKVAGLMTTDMLLRRLNPPTGIQRILVPGRCRGDLVRVGKNFGIPIERGPDELHDLPRYLGWPSGPPALDKFDVDIFAEIVDAPYCDVETLVRRGGDYVMDGADVIDLGALPEVPFMHLEQAIHAMHQQGWKVSVDSSSTTELERAAKAGADYLLSLKTDTLWIAELGPAIPILIPEQPQNLQSLLDAMDQMGERPYLADAILDPIHFGFADSLARFHELHRLRPLAPLFMGTGNLTELTDADTSGMHALLFGVASELGVKAILTTQVSPHAKSSVREADAARRMMFAARAANSLPRNFSTALLCLRERDPFSLTFDEVVELAAAIKDVNYRIQVTKEGLHLFNRNHHLQGQDPFSFFASLDVAQDAGHAFYLGVELARAQIAWELGKRYNQDENLNWGAAVKRPQEDLNLPHKLRGTTWKT